MMRRKKLLSLTVPLVAGVMMFSALPTISMASETGTTDIVPEASGDVNNKAAIPKSTNPPLNVKTDSIQITTKDCILDEKGKCSGHTITGGTKDDPATNTITVMDGTHKIILQNVYIDASGRSEEVSAVQINPNAAADIWLEGSNTLISPTRRAGLSVPEKATLNIYSEKNADNTFAGTLTVQGGDGAAGIGGQGTRSTSGTITIYGGNINATGGRRGAGIGGADKGKGGTITINDGIVNATGGVGFGKYAGGSGIGCGSDSDGGDVIINGGDVTATGGQNEDKTLAIGIKCNQLSSVSESTASIRATGIEKVGNFNGIIWDKDKKIGTVYGRATLNEDLDNQTLNIGSNSTLVIPPGGKKADNHCILSGTGKVVDFENLRGDGTIDPSDLLTQKVSLLDTDVYVSDHVYTGDDLTNDVIKIGINGSGQRYVENDPDDPEDDEYYDIDEPDSWTRKITWEQTLLEGKGFIQEAGSYTITYSKKGYKEIEKKLAISHKDLNEEDVIITPIKDQPFAGVACKPDPVIKHNRHTLVQNTDYKTRYDDNDKVGTASVTIKGVGNYTGEKTLKFKVVAALLGEDNVTIEYDSVEYDGAVHEPEIVVTSPLETEADGSPKRLKETDYEIKLSPEDFDFKHAGTVEYAITGLGNYGGTIQRTLTINPREISIDQANPPVAKDGGRPYKKDDTSLELAPSSIQFIRTDGSAAIIGKDDVKLESSATISSDNAGSYETVDLIDPKLGGKDGANYVLASINGIKLKEPAIISKLKVDPPELKIEKGVDYNVSEKNPNRFYCTVAVTNTEPGIEKYMYSMDDSPWQESPIFDLPDFEIAPGTTHSFTAYSQATNNVEESKPCEPVSVTFDLLDREPPKDWELEISEPSEDNKYTITIPEMEGAVYSFDGKNFKSLAEDPNANQLTGCESRKSYTGYIKYAATATHNESPVSTNTKEMPALTAKSPVISLVDEEGNPLENEGLEENQFFGSAMVKMSSPDDVEIYYTMSTDGEEPADPVVTGGKPEKPTKQYNGKLLPIKDDRIIIKAICIDKNEKLDPSTPPVRQEFFKVPKTASPPVISLVDEEGNPLENEENAELEENQFIGSAMIKMSSPDDVEIYYTMTTNGEEPADPVVTEGKPEKPTKQYKGKLLPAKDDLIIIKAICVDKEGKLEPSSPIMQKFVKYKQQIPKPTIKSSNGSPFNGSTTVSIIPPSDYQDAEVYYTTEENNDGTNLRETGTKYEGEFQIYDTTTVKAIAVMKDMTDSEAASETFQKSAIKIELKGDPKEINPKLDAVTENHISEELCNEIERRMMAEDEKKKEITGTEISGEICSLLAERILFTDSRAFSNKDIAYYEFSVMALELNKGRPRPATNDDFPKEGAPFFIDYPRGTSKDANDFIIIHMYGSGKDIGNIEDPIMGEKITKTPDCLEFTLKSASPIAIGWTKAVEGSPYANAKEGGEPSNDPSEKEPEKEPKKDDDTNSTPTPTSVNTNNDGNGSNTNGTGGTASVADAVRSAAATLLPKTGDTSKMAIWIVLAVVCIAVIAGVQIKSKKGKGKKKKH